MSTEADSNQWYYAQDGQPIGPLPFSSIEALAQSGKIAPDTLVAQEGGNEWTPLSSLSPVAQIKKESWVEHPAFVIASMFFCFPVGLFFVWKSRHFSTPMRLGWTAFFVLMGIYAASTSNKNTPVSTVAVQNEEVNPPPQNKPKPPPASSPPLSKKPAAGITAEAREVFRAELISLYQRLEQGRDNLAARDTDEIIWFRDVWAKQVEAIKGQVAADLQLSSAAGYLDSLRMSYFNSKGEMSASIRDTKEFLADSLETPAVFEVRSKADFDFILNGERPMAFGGVPVSNLADMIAAAKDNRIPWHIAESGLFHGKATDARLIRFNEEHLFYQSTTTAGESLIFALKRRKDIESKFASAFPEPAKLYEELKAGRAQEHDPLRQGYVILTSGYTWEGKEAELGKEVFLVRMVTLTDGSHPKPASSSVKSSSNAKHQGVVLNGTALFADKETLQLLDDEWNKSDSIGEAASQRMEREGKTWAIQHDTLVNVLEEGGPMDTVYVEAQNGGGKASRFWVQEFDITPMDTLAARWAMDSSKQASQSRFAHVLNGKKGNKVGAVVIGHLMELVAGLYEGTIPEADAKQCLVLPSAIGGRYPSDFQQVLEEHLIYEGVLSVRDHFDFALLREPMFEEGYEDLLKLYKEIQRNQKHMANPLRKGGLVYVGMEQFATKGGLVRQMPVFRVVNVQP